MTDQEIKAEAQKIIQEFYPNSCFDERTQNGDEAAKENAIIQVKALIKENHHMDNEFDLPVKVVDILSRRLDHFQSILIQLEKR